MIATAEAYLYQAASEQAKGIKRQQFLELAAEKYLVAIRFEPALLVVSVMLEVGGG